LIHSVQGDNETGPFPTVTASILFTFAICYRRPSVCRL